MFAYGSSAAADADHDGDLPAIHQLRALGGRWETIRPRGTLERARRTDSSRQCAVCSLALAAARVFRFRSGTMHWYGTEPVAADAAVVNPTSLVAVTATRSVEPASASRTT